MIARIDEAKNVLLVENSRFGINLFIRLEAEKHRRHIGTIDELNQLMFVEREALKHKMKVNNGYGFNHYILSNTKKFKDVAVIEYPDATEQCNIYVIPVEVILSNGDFLFFKKQGFEKQIFISKDFMKQYKVDEQNKINLLKQYKKVK